MKKLVAKTKKLTKGQSRRIRANQEKKLSKAKESIAWQDDELGEPQPGVIISRFGQHADVESEQGEVVRCNIRRAIKSLVCGDVVLWRKGKETKHAISGVIEAVNPRHSELVRPDVYDGIKAIAANIDQIFIVSSVLPAFNADIIDRYIVAAELTKIQPIILLNKIDLLDEASKAEVEESLAIYQNIGYQVERISCKQKTGIDQVSALIDNNTSIFVGQSGVGKSTLVNNLMPNLDLITQSVSENSGLGQHTTTVARLYHFPSGGQLIDSPGIREFGVWHLTPDNVFDGFTEFHPFEGGCKFRDCKHQNDPGCALHQAVKDGKITQQRLDSYHRIVQSINDNKLTSRFN